jgi:hypothetical protein
MITTLLLLAVAPLPATLLSCCCCCYCCRWFQVVLQATATLQFLLRTKQTRSSPVHRVCSAPQAALHQAGPCCHQSAHPVGLEGPRCLGQHPGRNVLVWQQQQQQQQHKTSIIGDMSTGSSHSTPAQRCFQCYRVGMLRCSVMLKLVVKGRIMFHHHNCWCMLVAPTAHCSVTTAQPSPLAAHVNTL